MTNTDGGRRGRRRILDADAQTVTRRDLRVPQAPVGRLLRRLSPRHAISARSCKLADAEIAQSATRVPPVHPVRPRALARHADRRPAVPDRRTQLSEQTSRESSAHRPRSAEPSAAMHARPAAHRSDRPENLVARRRSPNERPTRRHAAL